MAGAMRKAMVYLGLVEDEDRLEYDDYDQYDHDGEAADHDDRRDSRSGAGAGQSARGLAAERDGSSVATLPGRRPSAARGHWTASPRCTRRTYNEAAQSASSSATTRR